MVEMAVSGRRKRERSRRRRMYLEREDTERVGAKDRDNVNWVKWKIFLRCSDHK